ncbi:uncharacterized protein LOC105215940 [Zeugodacus cucurbitae]|uniref:Myosin light chain kinase, smooth muscle n=1 Tax=Zeugodacus cucurbitae TaxID=28588 RepID=A0A0A1XGR3_ZEUCU|nr:uncharacterized protein LOC105215940 [Zeugodacus cucurbitae]
MTSVRNNAVSVSVAALLLGWVIFGCLNNSVLADVAQKSGEKSTDSTDPDYFYDESSPENIKAASKPAQPTIVPYFDEPKKTVYAKENAAVTLTCPVQNYDESQHLIVWFKNNNTITTGKEIIADAALYHLDKDMNLVVDKVTEKTKGEYSCTVMPYKAHMDIHLEIGEEPVADNKQMMVSASALLLLLSTLVARELSFGILRLDTFF